MEHQHRVCYGFAMIAYADHYRLPGPDLRTEIPLVSFFCWVCLSRVTTALTATAHPVQSFTASCPLWQSCLYLPRPLTLERGCFLIEHTISSGCRTGGFCVPLGQRIQSLRSAKSACSGVGGVAKWRRFFINLRSAAASPGERKVYHTPVLQQHTFICGEKSLCTACIRMQILDNDTVEVASYNAYKDFLYFFKYTIDR